MNDNVQNCEVHCRLRRRRLDLDYLWLRSTEPDCTYLGKADYGFASRTTELLTTCTELLFLEQEKINFVLSVPSLLLIWPLLSGSVSLSDLLPRSSLKISCRFCIIPGTRVLLSNILEHQLHFMTPTAHSSNSCHPV